MSKQLVQYDQYRYYPAKSKDGWYSYLQYREELENENDESHRIDVSDGDSGVKLFSVNSEWDRAHFGYGVGKIFNPTILNSSSQPLAKKALEKSLAFFKKKDVRLVVARINGDNLSFIHALEQMGFNYYETIIWPVAKVANLTTTLDPAVSFIPSKIDFEEDLISIASNNQYQRGHYHCDSEIDKERANSLYAKWLLSAIKSNKKIAVIKVDHKVAGYFVCDIDPLLNAHLGAKYGRLQSLALNKSYRGHGLGRRLFESTLTLLKTEGCEYIDSGYATKNHLSAKLHADNSFSSVYEEITMHLWI